MEEEEKLQPKVSNPNAKSDEEAPEQCRAIFEERKSKFEAFEVWDRTRKIAEGPRRDDDDDIIIRRIDQAAAEADFVIVDLEGRATGLAGYAIAISDFVIIPVRGSNPDAKQAFRHMGLLKTQERLTGRAIPFAMLFTQTSPALRPKTQRFIEKRLAEENAPVFEVQLVDREAYRAMLSFGGTVAGLAGKGVSGLAAAVANANAFVDELLARLSNGNKPIEREEVA